MSTTGALAGGRDDARADAGGERVPLALSVLPEDCDYLDRRAAECGGDRSAALRRVFAEARTFRHDIRGKLGALDLIEMCLTTDAMTKDEAARLIAELRGEFRAMLEGVLGEG